MIEGNRVFVEGGGMTGLATIMYFFPNEIYPVQVEFDEPDENGHKIHRFTPSEIKEITAPNPQTLSGKHIARVNKKYSWYTVGDEYIIGPSKHESYFDVYTTAGHIMGSYIENFFEIIRPCEEPPNEVVIKPQITPVYEAKFEEVTLLLQKHPISQDEPKKGKIKRDKLKELEVAGQLNIFDFM